MKLEIVNVNYKIKEKYDVGGNWACIIGCGSVCAMGVEAGAAMLGSMATAL